MQAQWVCSRERRIALYKRSSINQFLVFSVTCETLTDDVTWCTINPGTVILSIYVLYLCTQEMSSFHFQIIIYFLNRTLNFYHLCHHFDQFSGEWPSYVILTTKRTPALTYPPTPPNPTLSTHTLTFIRWYMKNLKEACIQNWSVTASTSSETTLR